PNCTLMLIAGLRVRSPWAADAHKGAVVCARGHHHHCHFEQRLQPPLRLRVPTDTPPTPLLPPLLSPVEFIGSLALIFARICLNHPRANPQGLAVDEARHYRRYDDPLEDITQDVALTEPIQPVLRKRPGESRRQDRGDKTTGRRGGA